MSSARKYNIELANRQIEINEWTYKNKMDTLFIFQISFIGLLFVGVLMILNKMGIVPWMFLIYSIVIVSIILILIIINRSVYTGSVRDKRHWDRKHFSEDNTQVSPLGRGDKSMLAYIDSIRNAYGKPPPVTPSCTCPKSC